MVSRTAGDGGPRSSSRLQAALLGRLPVAVACVDAELRVAYANEAFAAAFGVADGADLRWADGPLAQLGAAVREVIGTRAATEVALDGQRGAVHVFAVDPQHAGVMVGGPPAGEPAPPDEQAALLRIAMLVARDAPEDVVFAAASEHTARLVGAQAGAVLRFMGAERAVVVGVWREGGIRGMPLNAELDFDAANSALGRVAVTGRPARADGYEQSSGELPMVMRAIGLRSTLAAPVHVHEQVWGALVASTTTERPAPGGRRAAARRRRRAGRPRDRQRRGRSRPGRGERPGPAPGRARAARGRQAAPARAQPEAAPGRRPRGPGVRAGRSARRGAGRRRATRARR